MPSPTMATVAAFFLQPRPLCSGLVFRQHFRHHFIHASLFGNGVGTGLVMSPVIMMTFSPLFT